MARHPYDRDHGRRGYDRHSYGQRGYRMEPGWGWNDSRDPNYRGGEYQGYRMDGDGRHVAAYGRERFYDQADLGAYGGFDGRYDLPDGWFDADGYYHEAYEGHGGRPHPRWVGQPPREEFPNPSGGVRYDREYLRQYNANSPALHHPGPDRSWGFSEGPGAPPMRGQDARHRRTEERRYPGYNEGGFSEGHYAGPGTRQSLPTQKGGR
jgi:hypothetical protein